MKTFDLAQTGLVAGTWDVDPNHTTVDFLARHLMVSRVRGKFAAFSGTIHIDDRPDDSHAEVTIDAASIDTGVADRDAHLKSADFLDVENHPTLNYRSTGLETLSDDRFRLDGELTIRGVTRPVSLDVTFEGVGPDPWGGTRAGFTARGEIDREKFGLTWNALIEGGGVVVGRKVTIELELQAIRRSE